MSSASKFKTAWGFVGVGMMQSDITVFGWGGSLAFRKGLFDEILRGISGVGQVDAEDMSLV